MQDAKVVELIALVLFGTGVYTNSFDVGLNIKNGFPVFTTMIEANYINKQEDRFAAFKLTDEDKQELHRLARDPRIGAPPRLVRFACACMSYLNLYVMTATCPSPCLPMTILA